MSVRVLLLLGLVFHAPLLAAESITMGSKGFTESVILGEILTQMTRSKGVSAQHRSQLGGTRVLWEALLSGEIDAYVDYTGTLREEIFAGQLGADPDALYQALAETGVRMSPPLGFNNTYALGMRRKRADALNIRNISDLLPHTGLVFGFSNEFMQRKDGWPGLQRAYGLDPASVRGMDHDLAYRALASGDIDVIDLYTTDADIAYYDLLALRDDRRFFPGYQAVVVYRSDLEQRAPSVVAAIDQLGGAIDAARMIAMNAAVKLDHRSESSVAAGFLSAHLGVHIVADESRVWQRVGQRTREHLLLVMISLAAAILVAIPLGVLAARKPRAGQVILALVGLLQTIPSLALFVFLIPLLGIGGPPAVAALFVYSLLPIVRNTHAGLCGIAPELRESALALGLPDRFRLWHIELPLATPAILTGIKTAAVINVGTATLAALIGAGGYGQPILTGIRLDDTGLIMQGAIPAAVLALLVQGLFEWLERHVLSTRRWAVAGKRE